MTKQEFLEYLKQLPPKTWLRFEGANTWYYPSLMIHQIEQLNNTKYTIKEKRNEIIVFRS